MQSLNIHIVARTPIWTGGIRGYPDRLHETGLIGSLRYWYEAAVRGLGGNACDPTSADRCRYDPRSSEPVERQICPSCYVFGTTGWRRQFKLDVMAAPGKEPLCFLTLDDKAVLNHLWLSKIFAKASGSELPFGEINLRLLCQTNEVAGQLKAVFALIHEAGAIGAKPQYGFGQIEWSLPPDPANTDAWCPPQTISETLSSVHEFLTLHPGPNTLRIHSEWPRITDLWKCELVLDAESDLVRDWSHQGAWALGRPDSDLYLPVSFDIRYRMPGTDDEYGLRLAYRNRNPMQDREVFGFVSGNDKLRSKVFVSHLFRSNIENPFRLRVWGFTPDAATVTIAASLCEMFELPEVTLQFFKNRPGAVCWDTKVIQ